jgi:hypothetical protein
MSVKIKIAAKDIVLDAELFDTAATGRRAMPSQSFSGQRQ